MKLITIFLMSLIFMGCSKKEDVAVDAHNSIETVVLSEEESRLLCDVIIARASDSKTPIVLLVSNIKGSPLWDSDRNRLLVNNRNNIVLTEEWAKTTIQIESARKDQSVGTIIPVLSGEDGGSMRITYQYIDRNGTKKIVPGLMQTICRIVTSE